MQEPYDWPVLTRYDRDHLARIALPLGGIGTGTVSLGGRGDLRDWEVVNRPAKGFAPSSSFFALYVQPQKGEGVTRLLEGPLELGEYEGAFGSPARNHGLPRFQESAFEAAYPFGQVLLSDPEVPVAVRLQAFNPLIPADAERSGIPIAVLRFVLTNRTERPVRASVCGSLQNFIGSDGTTSGSRQNVNEFRREAALAGIFLRSEGVDPLAETWGTLALATTCLNGVTHRTAWAKLSWGDSLLDFWDDFTADGYLEERDAAGVETPVASLSAAVEIAPGKTESLTFLLAWHFPNRLNWSPARGSQGSAEGCCGGGETRSPDWVGNYYATRFSDAWEVATATSSELPALERDTLAFVRAFCESDLPSVVKEAALSNLSTLRTQTCFRTADGFFFGWEGCGDRSGCCEGSCTHVWNYEQATAFLFGDLACGMRRVEFLHATRDDGRMSFRVRLPLSRATEWGLAAADGQMGCLMKLYRDWQLSGDDGLLRELWPRARKALEFCWVPGGWDADGDGVMEGCQHNTMDVEYYGPNPQMGSWYLGALRAAEEMSRHVGESDFAALCRQRFEAGSRWIDQNLFNGDYYEHQVRPPTGPEAIAPGLRHESMGSQDLSEPDLQLGAGCLVDQLVGQYMACVCGLGTLLDPEHVRGTLRAIMRYNFRESLRGHFNHLRSFALGDEAALLMASYPKGRRPRRPFPYFNEVMTGFEYTAAVHMLYEGLEEDGLKVIAAIRARYDGRKRSPFDEAECGHHYARAMASWAAVLALTGFHYSGVTQTIRFARADGPRRDFWSNGYAWGTCEQRPVAGGVEVRLTVLHGALALRRLEVTGAGAADLHEPRRLSAGESLDVTVSSA
jgi:non-lysosomal glucosylceramidase